MQEEGEPVCQHLLSNRFGPKHTRAHTEVCSRGQRAANLLLEDIRGQQRGGNLRPGGHRRPGGLFDAARRASQSFLQHNEEAC